MVRRRKLVKVIVAMMLSVMSLVVRLVTAEEKSILEGATSDVGGIIYGSRGENAMIRLAFRQCTIDSGLSYDWPYIRELVIDLK